MWDGLAETYDKIDGSVIFNLHYKINTLSQNGSKLSDYYHKLNSLWREYDAMVQLPICTCDSASSFKDHCQLLKLMQFVMRLDDIYAPIRSTFLTTNPLPTVKDAFSFLKNNTGQNSNNVSVTSKATDPSGGGSHTLTNDKRLMSLLSDSVPGYHVSLLFVSKLTKDSKLNVCFNEKDCAIQDSVLKSQVGTGSEKYGLYFLNLADQVLSVLKDDIDLKGDFSSEPCDVCHRAKQTREPFPLSDHKLETVGQLIHLDVWGPYRVRSKDSSKDVQADVGSSAGSLTLLVPTKRPPLVRNYALGLAAVKT
nr:hypothetical protein [Tanacetum cinerariifolium]